MDWDPLMDVPFTVDQFFDVFARYNNGVWPAQWLLNALAVVVVALVVQGRPSHGRWISSALALLWGWMAVAYHFAYFTGINPAAWAFGASRFWGVCGSRGSASSSDGCTSHWAEDSKPGQLARWSCSRS